jgi:hypothetical protein
MDERWSSFGVTPDLLESKATWLKEGRGLHGKSLHFFQLAGKLVSLSRDDYELASLAFFQSIIGLEKALRLHFASETDYLATLLGKVIVEGIVTDSVFSDVRPLPPNLLRKLMDIPPPTNFGNDSNPGEVSKLLKKLKDIAPTHCHALSILVPKLRNEFVHGTYLLSPDFLHMTFQMREIADVLKTKSV